MTKSSTPATPLEFHPLANMFPLLEGKEFDELVDDIKKNGQRDPIVLFGGKILDGRNRYRACFKTGVEPETVKGDTWVGDPAAYVISVNARRRHLKPAEKRKIIKALLKANPEKPDLQIAKTVNASPTTVGKVRSEMEAKGDVSTVKTRKDTKGRRQVARKPRRSNRATLRGHNSRPAASDTVPALVWKNRKDGSEEARTRSGFFELRTKRLLCYVRAAAIKRESNEIAFRSQRRGRGYPPL
jgi:hypothetical protein